VRFPLIFIQKPNPETMNARTSLHLFVRLLSVVSVLTPLAAQTVAPGTTKPPGTEDEKIVELSPFVVNSDKDTGYQATSTLAGTRLNTPVKDLGAAISIYTKDFLEDIGATNSSELLVYATGMEAAGPGGNFSGATNDINAVQVLGDAVRADPQQGTRTRGLSAPNFTRGFYTTDIAFDSYNTEAATVNRGPNAILFGVGSPAGVVDTGLLRPNLRRNTNKISVRYGDNDSFRRSIDVGRVLLDGKLAVRIAALHDEERYDQRPAFEEKKRIFGALTFAPYKSNALRINFETGRTVANRPITVLPFNSMSSAWFAAGRPGYDWTLYDDPARNPNATAQVNGAAFWAPLFGQQQLFDQVLQFYSSANASAPAYALRSETRVTTGNAANAVKAQVFQPIVNRDLGNDAIPLLTTVNVNELIGSYWTGANVLPGQQPGIAPAGIRIQGFTDFSAFDFRRRMIDETSRQGDSFHTFNVAFEQRAWGDRLGIELAYDTQRSDRRSKNAAFSSGNANHIRLDPNAVLPTGQPNPNYGRPFVNIYSQATWRNNFSERETLRATGFLKYDFKDTKSSWARRLGRHTVTGLYEETGTDTIGYTHRLAADGAAARDINANINVFARRPGVIVYMGPSLIGNNNPLQLEPIRVPVIEAGPLAVPVRYFVRAANATDPGAFVDAPASLVEINAGGNAQRDLIKSTAALLQSYWLQDHLVTLVGWRRDADYFVRTNIGYIANPSDQNDPGKVHYGFDDFSFPGTPPRNVAAETWTYSGVLRWPQKLIKLPAGTDFSVFYNQSSNFTPSGGRVTAFNEPQASPRGRTKQEYGFNISALHDMLNLRVNWFETGILGQSFTPPVYNTVVNNAILQAADTWGVEANTNPHLAAMRNADIELLFSPLPANFRQLYGWGILGAAPSLAAAGRLNALSGAGDTTDFTAKGMEIEVVFNPTRNWRILMNVAKQETVQTNSLPFLKHLISLMTPVWNQLRDRARTNYPVGWQPGDPMTGIFTFGDYLDANVTVPFATAIATEGSASAEQRKWRANLVTNYTFRQSSLFGEKLKGFGVGGAVRWQDKIGIGYPTTRNADMSVTLDRAHPYYAPAEANYDAWISYERRLWSNRINWKAQLNARNLFGGTDPIGIGVQPWGDFSTVRLAPERRWYLTNTFSF
jgi:outer membrane receptor protein involved in Fe transport